MPFSPGGATVPAPPGLNGMRRGLRSHPGVYTPGYYPPPLRG